MKPIFVPSPIIVFQAIPELLREGFLRDAATSFLRVTAATALSALIAVPLGLMMGAFTRVRALISPLTEPLRYLPIAAIVALTIVWFGINNGQKVVFLFIGTVVYLIPLVVGAADRVDAVYLNTGYTLGATRWQTLRQVILPVSLPDIAEAIRVINGIGWTYIILAEIVGSESGLGHLIYLAQKRSRTDKLFVEIVTILAIGIVTDRLISLINRKLFKWSDNWS
jgi:NitT/TauT family transport system permease protein